MSKRYPKDVKWRRWGQPALNYSTADLHQHNSDWPLLIDPFKVGSTAPFSVCLTREIPSQRRDAMSRIRPEVADRLGLSWLRVAEDAAPPASRLLGPAAAAAAAEISATANAACDSKLLITDSEATRPVGAITDIDRLELRSIMDPDLDPDPDVAAASRSSCAYLLLEGALDLNKSDIRPLIPWLAPYVPPVPLSGGKADRASPAGSVAAGVASSSGPTRLIHFLRAEGIGAGAATAWLCPGIASLPAAAPSSPP